ncbi:ribosome maturation factor RimM [Nakamurella antarctica]|uniref:Ribosome maturation factor RimM n=1 Tax=Nakamurella antarctica TaxID=1902245 RepID=A0A3G8ZTM9_9ACTN|nr:ribosome maturation factor RimM [Nakamurella antarctica]AZI57824.1 ribosome maturation factor RimM [Nakamurella antarctica]
MELVVGRIGRPHGLAGGVTVEVRTDDPETRFAAGSVFRTDPAATGPLTLSSLRRIGGNTVLTFDGFADRNAAEALRGTLLIVDTEALPELEDSEEFYDHQLVGLNVLLIGSDEVIGCIADMMHLPSNDVLVVKTPTGEVLIPFVSAIVPTVDLAGGFVVVDPPDGLLDDGLSEDRV